jgi:peptide methionine sulfoxide reductase msrA/msrB
MTKVLNPHLTPFERHVIVEKGTERPNTGMYTHTKAEGTYICKNCSNPLFTSEHKFDSHCGWPSFDGEIAGAIKKIPDPDGSRTEIVCSNCDAHLGHVFLGEGFTSKNLRHCVNSISMVFVPNELKSETQTALLASGCFWGTEYHFSKVPGVLSCTTGYAGGHVENPSYKEVCTGKTGHLEVVQVRFDAKLVSFENLLKLFFETHDFSQTDGQGPDIGSQYLSAIFCLNEDQFKTAKKLADELTKKGYSVATQIKPNQEATIFWKAEEYHQNYYFREASTPYCHVYRKIF